ncbi:MAG: GlcG protein [Caulobacteraceae bacterium]|nr:GlcG protein [Caulobacteraceae bacterium]
MSSLSLEQASHVVDATLERGVELGLHPLTVAVLDAGGHLVAFKRQDRSGILRYDIAFGKAWGVLGMGLGGRELARRAEIAPAFFTALASASGGRVVPVPGGVLILDEVDDVIGAVGVSGDTSDNDEVCAIHGVLKAGLKPNGGPR